MAERKRVKAPRYYHFAATGPGKGYLARGVVNSDFFYSKGIYWLSPKDGWPKGYCNLECPPWRFPDYPEVPKISWNPKVGPLLDVVGYTVYIISDVARNVFDAVDPSAFEYRDCESVLPDGSPGPKTWLCSVKRGFCNAVDLDASISVKSPNPKIVTLIPPVSKVKFRLEIIGDSHIFHVAEGLGAVCCDDVFRNACREAKLTGVRFGKLF